MTRALCAALARLRSWIAGGPGPIELELEPGSLIELPGPWRRGVALAMHSQTESGYEGSKTVVGDLLGRFKYGDEGALGPMLGRALARALASEPEYEGLQIVTHIPATRKGRGPEPACELARAVARGLGVRCLPRLIARTRRTELQKDVIEWAEKSWNPIVGCTPVSEGCRNCYAAREASGRLKHHPRYKGLAKDGKWTGEVRLNKDQVELPLRWKKPRRIFVCSHGDLFHAKVPASWIVHVFEIMAAARQHTFLVLTKRPENVLKWLAWADDYLGGDSPYSVTMEVHGHLPNIIWGTTAENQRRADERIPLLLQIPGAAHFVSAEPLLGPIELWRATGPCGDCEADDMGNRRILDPHHDLHPNQTGEDLDQDWCPICTDAGTRRVWGLDWVVVGGESGPNARPMHPDWARRIRDDCQEAGVPFFFKQWGEWGPISWQERVELEFDPPRKPIGSFNSHGFTLSECGTHLQNMARLGKKAAGRMLDGRTWDEFPQ